MKQLPILFTYEDLKDIYPNISSFYSFVYRSCKKGNIRQIKKGLYALVDPSTGEIYANKFQIASHLFNDSYFSYHEALEYYGLTNQSFVSIFTYLTHIYTDDVVFNDVTYMSKKNQNTDFILNRIKEEGVRVVTLERAIIDSIDCPSLAGGLEEIEYALSLVKTLDWSVVETLLLKYDKSSLYQKTGYLLQKYFINQLPDRLYKLCLDHCHKKIVYFDSNPYDSIYISKWKLMVKKEDRIDELY